MLAATITVAACLAGRVQSRALNGINDLAEARSNAQAAIDLGRLYIAQDSYWRTDRANGTWFAGMAIGSGSMQLDVANPNGTLNHFNADPILMTGTGTCGTSVQKMQVSVTPQIKPYNCLAAAMISSSIQFQSSRFPTSGVLIASNGAMQLTSATIAPNLEAVGAISAMSAHYSGTITSGVPARTMPGSDVFDYYIANGTAIPLGSLLTSRTISNGVLSPTVNTVGGGTNANGIYVIDCQNNAFTITNCRICATVVLLNCGGLTINFAVNWTPAVSTLPSLLVQGDITSIKMNTLPLSEVATLVNYNPPGAPYPWPIGSTNILPVDLYPTCLRGLIYATGNVTFGDNADIGMLMAGGTIFCGSKTTTLNYDSTYLNNPPPGFYGVDMTPASTTYTQLTN
jgi:hypothetical protein